MPLTLTERLRQIISQSEEGTTPPPWNAHRSTTDDGEWIMGIDMPNGKELPEYHWQSTDREAGSEWNNAEFIASSRVLVPALARALVVAVESLTKISDPETHWVSETRPGAICARKALAEIEKLLEAK